MLLGMRPLAAALTIALIACADRAAAQVEGPGWAFGEPEGEVALTLLGVASLAAFALPQREDDWKPFPIRPRNELYGTGSDYIGGTVGTAWQVFGGFALEASYFEEEYVVDSYDRALRSSLVEIEASLIATGATIVLKRATGRCRPRAWVDGRCVGEFDAFPSGHTAPVAAVAGSRLVMLLRSGGPPPTRVASFALAEGATLVTALFRVLAGAHSLEDVAVAWALGHAAGVGVAFAHPMETLPVLESAAASAGAELRAEASYGWAF